MILRKERMSLERYSFSIVIIQIRNTETHSYWAHGPLPSSPHPQLPSDEIGHKGIGSIWCLFSLFPHPRFLVVAKAKFFPLEASTAASRVREYRNKKKSKKQPRVTSSDAPENHPGRSHPGQAKKGVSLQRVMNKRREMIRGAIYARSVILDTSQIADS
jgi:hypothetical protein